MWRTGLSTTPSGELDTCCYYHHWVPRGRCSLTWRACRYCELNPNAQFASCSVPQELTNEEIDHEAAEVSAAAAAAVQQQRA
jgi:hypothetical protein